MSWKEYALKLKKELEQNPSPEKAQEIARKISNKKYTNGEPLSDADKKHIVNYIGYPGYDPKTGKFPIFESDNSEFLKLVAIVSQNVNAK